MEKYCKWCKKQFKSHYFKYCSNNCLLLSKKEKGIKKRSFEKKCSYCKKIFLGNKTKKYCSNECRKIGLKNYNKLYMSDWAKNNRVYLREYGLYRYYKNHKQELIWRKNWRQKNKKRLSQRERNAYKYKIKNDINFKLRKIFRDRMNGVIKNEYKAGKSLKLLGCSVEEFKQHIEKQFKEGMNWKNHGMYGWHIDHIIPCSAFNLLKEKDQKKCFHYTNLQPLWANENLSKSDY